MPSYCLGCRQTSVERDKGKVSGWHDNPEFLLCEVIWSCSFRTLEIINFIFIF